MSESEQILTLPLLPLKNNVLFPSVLMPLTVGRPLSMAAIEAVLAREDKELIIAAQRDASEDTPGPHDFFSIGTKAVIKRMARRQDGGVDLMVQGGSSRPAVPQAVPRPMDSNIQSPSALADPDRTLPLWGELHAGMTSGSSH
jgi:ATP-dependent Lon protease